MVGELLLRGEDLGYCRRQGEEGGGGGRGFIFRHYDFALHRGECLHVIGGNGVGKTSLLKLCVGLSQASEGQVDLAVNDILYVGHENSLADELTVWEHLRFWYGLGGEKGKGEGEGLLSLAESWFASHLLHRSVALCSAGERRRLSLLRLCLWDVDLWVLDEPFAALDDDYRHRFVNLFRQHCEGGGGIIVTGHNDNLGGKGGRVGNTRRVKMGGGG